MSDPLTYCAQELLEVIPPVARRLRGELRSHMGADLSFPQYRALMFIRRHPGASLSDLAARLELTLPSASRLVDGLVSRGLVSREMSSDDRRRVTLALTEAGRALYTRANQDTLERLEGILGQLNSDERETILAGLHVLRGAFDVGQPDLVGV